MYFDHIDIGTSDFDVADGLFLPEKKYLLVEPMAEYLDKLPTGDYIHKEYAACSNIDGFLDIHYISPDEIQRLQLPDWVRGCNRLCANHKAVSSLLNNAGISTEVIAVRKVPTITFKNLCHKHNITSAGFIKIDTEGHDHIILKQIAELIIQGNFKCDLIKVEYIEEHGNTKQLDDIAFNLRKFMPNFKFDSENLILWI